MERIPLTGRRDCTPEIKFDHSFHEEITGKIAMVKFDISSI